MVLLSFLCFCLFVLNSTTSGNIYKENQQTYVKLLDTFTGFEFIDFFTIFQSSWNSFLNQKDPGKNNALFNNFLNFLKENVVCIWKCLGQRLWGDFIWICHRVMKIKLLEFFTVNETFIWILKMTANVGINIPFNGMVNKIQRT